MAREFLLIVQESALKTPVVSPVIWTTATAYGLANYQALYVRLDGGNGFTMRSRPVQVEVPYGGGFAVGAYRVSDKSELKGQLTLKLCVGQAPFLMSWAINRINAGQTAPWTTTEIAGDLASCTIYHATQRADGTYKRRRYLGCKVDSWNLAISEDSTVSTLQLGISGCVPEGNQFDSSTDPSSTIFPAPADNHFPVDPYVFIHTSGQITIGSGVRDEITGCTMAAQNVLARRFYNNRYIQILRFLGRKTTAAVNLLYATTPDDRERYEGLFANGVAMNFNNGTHGMNVNMYGENVFDPMEDDLPLGDLYFQNSTLNNLWDETAGADVAVTFT